MKRKPPFLLVPVAALLALAFVFQAGEKPSANVTSTSGVETSVTAGMRLYVDPDTKQIIDSPVAQPTADGIESLQSLFNTSHVGLVEVEGPVGGGKMVDLKGRFQHAYTAAIDASGNLSAGCGAHLSEDTSEADGEKEGE
jgi:hypothetical protein